MSQSFKVLGLFLLLIGVGSAVSAQTTMPSEDKAKPSEGDAIGAVKTATVHFIEPKDGAVVGKTFKMKFAVDGLKVMKAGDIIPGTGHFHVIVNGDPLKEGEVVPTDERHIHYGKGQTEAELTLPPGSHALTLQFADGAHRAYHKFLTQTIRITVK